MNVFNRIVIALLLVGFIPTTIVISLLPKPVIEGIRGALEVADSGITPMTQLVGAIIGLLITLAAFLLLVAELRPPARQSVVVAQTAGGTAELTNESVAIRVRRVAEAIQGVREAVPAIRSHGKAVDITLKLATDSDVDIPQKSEEVMQAVRSETETKIGVPIKSLRVTFKHGSSDRRGSSPEPATPAGDSLRV